MMSEYMRHRLELKNGRAANPAKERKTIAQKSEKKKIQEKEEKRKGPQSSKYALNMWFAKIQAEHFDQGVCQCMECGSLIPESMARHATAHLLPKKLFKSIAIHPLNYLILGVNCGCHDRTHRVDTFIKMKIWSEAARRIKDMLQTDLPHDELKYLSNQLLQALDKTDV